jgi:cell division protein FtsB
MRRHLLPAVLIALLLAIQGQLWFGRGSIPKVAQMNEQLKTQNQQNQQAQLANNQLAAEVRDLKEGLEMVEEKARLELGMVKPNEIYVQIGK